MGSDCANDIRGEIVVKPTEYVMLTFSLGSTHDYHVHPARLDVTKVGQLTAHCPEMCEDARWGRKLGGLNGRDDGK